MKTPATLIDSARPLATTHPWTICGISRGQWYRLASSGRTPLPVRLGKRRPVYLLRELELWLQAGAPNREVWQAQRDAALLIGGAASIAQPAERDSSRTEKDSALRPTKGGAQ
jgi:predicted DNA-binding transcriptional regulator AlpA